MTRSAKHGFCPVCKGSIKRQGLRKLGKRVNVIPIHIANGVVCGGGNLDWCKAMRQKVHYRVRIEELPGCSL